MANHPNAEKAPSGPAGAPMASMVARRIGCSSEAKGQGADASEVRTSYFDFSVRGDVPREQCLKTKLRHDLLTCKPFISWEEAICCLWRYDEAVITAPMGR